jgi:NADPH-dependent curcumin reductase CurA
MGHARISERAGESDAKAFTRLYESNAEFRKADRAATEAGWIEHHKSNFPNMMDVTPQSTEVGNTLVGDDSAAAYTQFQQLAEKQHRTFEEVSNRDGAVGHAIAKPSDGSFPYQV